MDTTEKNEILIRNAIAEAAFIVIELSRELIQREGKTCSEDEQAAFEARFDLQLKSVFNQIKVVKKLRELESVN